MEQTIFGASVILKIQNIALLTPYRMYREKKDSGYRNNTFIICK